TLQSHAFIKSPGDRQCLSCHYGNYVGADYHGKFENDYNWEYRTPYTTKEDYIRPYGVEQHDLVTDIPQQRGLVCIDCHLGSALKGAGSGISCLTCHGWRPDDPKPNLAHIKIKGEQLNLHARQSGKIHAIPQLKHPAHQQYKDLVDCQVCHAQWSFNDHTTHLLLSTLDEYDAWDRLTVQSSSEVEALLEHNLYSDEDEMEPAMRDGITGESRPGIWYKGFTQRRWEDMIIAKDKNGIIKVFRPVLDLRLSAINNDEEVLFDNVKGNGPELLPYTPHTTGPAGLFYLQRFNHLLPNQSTEKKNK
ncbi:MAG: hypothetical protein GQ559_03620, partial [Desulfobulbaceae bacterium]|nr:hypothetical protein [Desulfobulbaceae bacterium]